MYGSTPPPPGTLNNSVISYHFLNFIAIQRNYVYVKSGTKYISTTVYRFGGIVLL